VARQEFAPPDGAWDPSCIGAEIPMPNVTELATAQLNHSPDDTILIELIEDLDVPAAIRDW
jgi:hypothetical protein